MGIAGLVILKKRIKSVESTRKLTKAMSLVATSKLKKVRNVLDVNNNYFQAYKEIMSEIIPSLPDDNEYMRTNNSNKKLVIVIASDMGMCGAYNNTIVSGLEELVQDNKQDYTLLVLGERGKSLCKRHGFQVIDNSEELSEVPTMEDVKSVFEYGLEKFSEGLYGEIIVVYTWFKNTITREVKSSKLLPLDIKSFEDKEATNDQFEIEGNSEELVELLVPSYCSCMLLNAMLNSKASEHSIRTETMNSATRNADDLTSALKLKYNRIRQGAITQEISEIVGGVNAQG